MPRESRSLSLYFYTQKLNDAMNKFYAEDKIQLNTLKCIKNRAKEVLKICDSEIETRFPKEEED